MKIKQEHINHITLAIQTHLANYPNLVTDYETGNFIRADKVKDLQTRFMGDIANAAGLTPYFCNVIYEYANDTHIATVLKLVCPKLTRRY